MGGYRQRYLDGDDPQVLERTLGKWPGVYRGICADNHDPTKAGRIRIHYSAIWGYGRYNYSPWTENGASCFGGPDAGTFMVPPQGALVYFSCGAMGDPSFPIFLGSAWGGEAEGDGGEIIPSQVPSEAKYNCPEDYSTTVFGYEPSLCLGCLDAEEHATDEYDNTEHAGPFGRWHRHEDGIYYCPHVRMLMKSEKGASVWAEDKDGREHLFMADRIGQCLKMKGLVLPELQVVQDSKGNVTGRNACPRGQRIMDRKTQFTDYDGYLPSQYCVDGWASVELHAASRGFLRFEEGAATGEKIILWRGTRDAEGATASSQAGPFNTALTGGGLELSVDGVPVTIALPEGLAVTPQQVVEAINGTVMGAAGSAIAVYDEATNAVQLVTAGTLELVGGAALGALGFALPLALEARNQSIIIEHMAGHEKIVLTTVMGHQFVLDSTAEGRWALIDAATGSYEMFESATATKEEYYEGGRICGVDFTDILTVLGDWIVAVGFPSPLLPKLTIDPLPVLDEQATLGDLEPGGFTLAGSGNIVHLALANIFRWAGITITDVATLNYNRVVGAAETINIGAAQVVDIGAAQMVTVGASQWIDVGVMQNILVGADRTLTVLGAEEISVGAARIVNVGANLTHEVAGVYVMNAGIYATQWALGTHDIKSALTVRLMGGCANPLAEAPLLGVMVAPIGTECEECGAIASATVLATA